MRLILAILLLTSCSTVLSYPSTNDGAGFYKDHELSLNSNVSKSIYQVMIIDKEVEIPESLYEKILNFVKNSTGRKINEKEVNNCKSKKLSKCKITEFLTFGTVFSLDGHHNKLFTARHTFDSCLKKMNKQNKEKFPNASPEKLYKLTIGKTCDLLLVNSENEILIDTRKSGALPFLSYGAPELSSQHSSLIKELYLDWAILEVKGIQIKEGLKYSFNNVSYGEEVILGGFPKLTTGRKELGKNDSNGQDLFFCKGKSIPENLTFDPHFPNFMKLKSMNAVLHERFISIDADGVPGQSGGPILNEKDEVIGLFLWHNEKDGNKDLAKYYNPNAGIGVLLNSLKEQKALK